MSSVDRGDRGWRARGTLALLLALALVAVLVDRSVTEPASSALERPVTLTAGRTTCAAFELGGGSEVIASSVGQPAAEGVHEDASATLLLQQEGRSRTLVPPDVTGRAIASIVAGQDAAALTARWEHTPVLLSRRWTVDGSARVPGPVEGPCPAGVADRWVVPGVVTAGGASASLYLANPTEAPAAVAVTFTTPSGPVEPTRLANLVVPANGRTVVDINEFAPEEPDLGIVVVARAGRVVAEAVQTLEAAVGGVDGRSLVVAHPEVAELWTLPWVEAGEAESAWVWVTNPGDVPTDVRLVLHTPGGPIVPPASGVTLAPGTTERIDLRGALAETGTAGVTVRASEGTGIVVAGAVLRSVEEDPVRSGYATLEAAVASGDTQAALSAVGGGGRTSSVVLTNPTDAQAAVTVRVVGRNASTPRQVVAAHLLPAGTTSTFDLEDHVPLEGGYAVLVQVDEGAVVAAVLSTSDEGPLGLTGVLARPFPVSTTAVQLPLVVDPALLHPLGDLAPDDDPGTEVEDGVEGGGDPADEAPTAEAP